MAIYHPIRGGGDDILCGVRMNMLLVGCLLMLMSMEVVGFKGGSPASYAKKEAIVSVTEGGVHKCHAILIVNMSTILGPSGCILNDRSVVGGEDSTNSIKSPNAQKKKITKVVKHCDGRVSLGTLESAFSRKKIDFFIPHWIPEPKVKDKGMMLSWGRTKKDGEGEDRKLAQVELGFKKCGELSKLSGAMSEVTKPTCAEHSTPEKIETFADDLGAVILMKLDKFKPNPVGFLLDQETLEIGGSSVPQLFEDTSKYACWAINFLWETQCDGSPIGKCTADLAPGEGRAPQNQINTTTGQLLFWIQIAMAGFIHRYLFQ